ncbi:response regulator transcription factor [Alkaliphilus serpentinus]|uniref:Stage 0 sporulation protein A homolog n=1 Tax=Alkaliphilus serpentinus TaxID=1482731 RepID=A0A833HPP6_9FIRM|nr:response regulator transcription factor [Alkaliphilus serpentinus]KAB3531066.1 response regulator transcription factor [Alkaliphilus serpentinus]
MKKIFVVEDEFNIRDLIKRYLEKEGYNVITFQDGTLILQEIKRLKPDLLVLDIMLPGINGLELCKEIRKESNIPIIFVSARDEEFDRILGLEIGGDDYLSKPFSPRELVARVKNIFRRLQTAIIEDKEIEVKDIKLFTSRRYVECNGEEIKLSNKEYELFEFLCKHQSIPFTREQLQEKVWGYEYICDSRIVDDLVKRLRKKLKEKESLVDIITVWGYGYKIDG